MLPRSTPSEQTNHAKSTGKERQRRRERRRAGRRCEDILEHKAIGRIHVTPLSARVFLLGSFFSQPESLQSRGLLSKNLCLDFVVHAEIVIFPCSLLQPRLHSRILTTSSHGSRFFWHPRADRSPLRPLRFSPPPPCPIEALLTVQFFRERRDPRPHNPALPSCLLEPARLS